MRLQLVAAAAAALLAAACSSGGHQSKSSSGTPTPSTSAYVPGDSDDAATIASHIPGCANVMTGSVKQGAPAMVSTASCTLTGHLVIVDTWASNSDATFSYELTKPDHVPYAHGLTWTAILGDQGVTADKTVLQMQLTNDTQGIGDLAFGGDTPAPVPPAAAQPLLQTVASALSGSVTST